MPSHAKPDEIWAPSISGAKNPRQGRPHFLREFLEIRKLSAFSSVMATSWDNVLLTGDHPPGSIQGILLSANAFQFLGVPPVIGRTILPADLKPSGEPERVTAISYKAWQRWFNGEADAIGKTLLLNNQAYTVIGVMPLRFEWYGNDGLWLPLPENERADRMVNTIMRLAPGVSDQTARAQLHAVHTRMAQENPKDFPAAGFTTRLTNYMDVTVASGEMKSSLLFGGVAHHGELVPAGLPGARLAAIGLGGLPGSFSLARYLRSEVFEVPARDPLAISGVAILLSAAAFLACYIPARRAAKLDPTAALRFEWLPLEVVADPALPVFLRLYAGRLHHFKKCSDSRR